MLNIQLIPVAGDALGMLPDQLDFVCRRNNIQGIYLNPSCNNPTTVTMDINRRKDIAEVIKQYKLILLEDDTYSFLAPQDYVPDQFVYMHNIANYRAD